MRRCTALVLTPTGTGNISSHSGSRNSGCVRGRWSGGRRIYRRTEHHFRQQTRMREHISDRAVESGETYSRIGRHLEHAEIDERIANLRVERVTEPQKQVVVVEIDELERNEDDFIRAHHTCF